MLSQVFSVGSAGAFVPRCADRPLPPLPWEQHPRTCGPSAASSPPGEEADPVPPASAKMASQIGAPSPFFLFLRYEVEIPRQHEVEIPPRMRRLWLRPHYEEVPAKLTFRAFS